MPVYVNRLLNLKKIKVIGFDMDYTLVPYNTRAFESLAHSLAVKRLVEKFGYPAETADLEFDVNRAIVGLVIDKAHGNLLKLSRFGRVKLAFHGLEKIDFREHSRIYRSRVLDLRDSNYQVLDTAFAISLGVLFSQLVQMKKEGRTLPGYKKIADDVNLAVDSLHTDGSIKGVVLSKPEDYVIRDSETTLMLERLKGYGKKLMVITNSDYAYTCALLEYAMNPFLKQHKTWQELFDLVVTLAEKPRFFENRRRFLSVNPEDGRMTNHEGAVSEGLWQGGWHGGVQEGLGVSGDEILYIGDHIFGDVLSIKKQCEWRTALVLGGLEGELDAIHATQKKQLEIDELMERKSLLEQQADEAEMTRHFGGHARISEKKMSEQDELNVRISELVEERKLRFNPYWGEIFRAGSEESWYAEQVERYACVYMPRVVDFGTQSPRTYFRPARRPLAHEPR